MEARNMRILRAVSLLITVCLFCFPAHAQYSGGTGEPNNPYLLYTAEQMNTIGAEPNDWDKHFKLMADIDLSGYVYDRAVIAPDTNAVKSGFQGTHFTGVFDGNGYVISHLTIVGDSDLGLFGRLGYGAGISNLGLEAADVKGTGGYVGGLVGWNEGSITTSYSTGSVGGDRDVGGLVGKNNGSIATSYSTGTVSGDRDVGGLVGSNGGGGPGGGPGSITASYSTGSVGGDRDVGGLAGGNGGSITNSYSTGTVSGDRRVGGLAGSNGGWFGRGSITTSYNTGLVSGFSRVGGLVGDNDGSIATSYSTGMVSGAFSVGGLVGDNNSRDTITSSFWDIQTSGQTNMCGYQEEGSTGCDHSYGKTTAEMQTASTFLEAGWDFVGETENGTDDIWWVAEGYDYPRLWWQYGQAFNPIPADGATDISPPVILEWISGGPAMHHDIYLGQDRDQVTFATPETVGVYSGRQTTGETSYNPRTLDRDKTYYWRIDEVDETDPNSPWRGDVWSFTTADYIVVLVVDDFESYRDDQNLIWDTWKDGFYVDANNPGNGTGSTVGNMWPPFAEQVIVHGGKQSMLFHYDNDGTVGEAPYEKTGALFYSETERPWETPQDWTIDNADTLTLYFRGEPDNTPDPFYVAIEDSAGQIVVVAHWDADAVLATEWQRWDIPLVDLQTDGVDVASVKKMYIGVGDRNAPQPGGKGRIYIDDIRVTRRMP